MQNTEIAVLGHADGVCKALAAMVNTLCVYMHVYLLCVYACIPSVCVCMYTFCVHMYVYLLCIYVCICAVLGHADRVRTWGLGFRGVWMWFVCVDGWAGICCTVGG